jgi:putative PIN family toxin of toxin-antitoxin system
MPQRPRVVADSNVIISAFHRGGQPLRVLHAARGGVVRLFYSPFILEEVTHILTSQKFAWPPERVGEAIAGLPGEVIVPGPRTLHVVADETDNRILECAVAAHAEFLVTGDRHLLSVGRYFRTRIVTVRDFLSAL